MSRRYIVYDALVCGGVCAKFGEGATVRALGT